MTPMQHPLAHLERDGIRLALRDQVLECRLHEPKRQHGRMSRFLCALEDKAFESVGFRRPCDEEMAYLRPVELDVFGLHRSHTVAQVVADTDRGRVCFEVVHCYRDVEVGREKEPKPVTHRQFRVPARFD